MSTAIVIRAGDTEPLELTVNAAGLLNLDELDSAVLYMRAVGADTNHVDGAALSVVDSAAKTLRFDPVGAAADGGDAFDEAGRYRGYLLLTWTDLDETRHPDNGDLTVTVLSNYE